MYFIGIITDLKSEKNIIKFLENNKKLQNNNVIFIKESNIDNIKNVHFDMIILNRKFEKNDELNQLLENTNYVIVNMDVDLACEELNIEDLNLITYGFNSKSTITISSVTDEDVLICVQRNLYNKYGKIEVQEIKVEFDVQYNIYDLIILVVMFLIYVPNNLVFKV